MVHEGLRNVAAGANPMGLRKGIEAGVEAAVSSLKALARETETKGQIAQVAGISAADPEIGELISEAIEMCIRDRLRADACRRPPTVELLRSRMATNGPLRDRQDTFAQLMRANDLEGKP